MNHYNTECSRHERLKPRNLAGFLFYVNSSENFGIFSEK